MTNPSPGEPQRAVGLPPHRWPPRPRAAFVILGVAAVLGAGLVAGLATLALQLSWPHREPAGDPEFGINFSCNHAEYLLLEDPALGPAGYVSDDRPGRAEWCASTLGTLLQATGARHVRISVEWSRVEPQEGSFDFRSLDAQLAEAARHGAGVLLTVGLKGQRHPEYYLPGWLLGRVQLPDGAVVTDNALVRAAALRMIDAVVRHVVDAPAIEAWSADNEPLWPSPRSHDWTIGADFVRAEVDAFHWLDPRGRSVVVAAAQHWSNDQRWRQALALGDVLGASIYPFRRYSLLGHEFVVSILEFGPFTPNYADQARQARSLGKDYWLTEMQAEPFAEDLHNFSPAHPPPDMSPAKFRQNIDYARRTGASRVYLWGAEWWLYQRDHFGDSTWLELAREALSPAAGGAARSPGGWPGTP